MAQVKRYKTLEDAIEAKEVFAVNVSDKKNSQAKGTVCISISLEGQEDAEPINIPATWIPFDLTDWAPLSDLARSSTLRSSIRQGLILLITKDSAKALQEEPGYEQEHQKVKELQKRSNTISSDSELSSGDTFELNTGVTAVSRDPIIEEPKTAERASVVNEISISALVAHHLRDETKEMMALATETFPKFSKQDFIELSTRVTNQASLLAGLAMDATGIIDDTGNIDDISALPAYQEWQQNNPA